ncbi:MAG: type II toxin-antitoxin system RelE/ParE family toxin [Sphingomonas bacterium]
MRLLRYSDAAQNDLATIALYIARESNSRAVAVEFVERLRHKCRQLGSLPGTLGTARPELRPDIRSTPLGNYVIFFRYGDGLVEIVNVLEGHRDIDAFYGDA